MLPEQGVHGGAVLQVYPGEGEARQVFNLRQPRQLEIDVVVVVEVVQADHLVAPGQQFLGDVKADEARGAGNQYVHNNTLGNSKSRLMIPLRAGPFPAGRGVFVTSVQVMAAKRRLHPRRIDKSRLWLTRAR